MIKAWFTPPTYFNLPSGERGFQIGFSGQQHLNVIVQKPAQRPRLLYITILNRFESDGLRILKFTKDLLVLELDSKAGLLFYLDRYNDRWKAAIDGRGAPLLRINGLFKGLEVGEGRKTVTFEFRDFPLKLSLAITLASSGILFILVFLFVLRSAAPLARDE